MANIDTKLIEGFDSMSDADKLKALLGYNIPNPDYSGYVKKDVFDKTASECAEWKRKHNALLSDDDKKKQEQEAAQKELQEKYDKLLRESTVSATKAKLVAMGYEDKLAQETAVAMVDGDNEKVFANQQKFITAHDQAYKAELLKGTPKPDGGNGGDGTQSLGAKYASQFNAMYVAPTEKE